MSEPAGSGPSPGHLLRVDNVVGGFQVQVLNASCCVVQSFPPLPAAGAGRLVREWCEGRIPRLRAGEA